MQPEPEASAPLFLPDELLRAYGDEARQRVQCSRAAPTPAAVKTPAPPAAPLPAAGPTPAAPPPPAAAPAPPTGGLGTGALALASAGLRDRTTPRRCPH